MILDLAADSSAATRGVAAVVLALHIVGGFVGLVAGAVAMLARKGSPLHRRAGHWFFVAMLTMSAIGAVVAPLLGDRVSAVAGATTFYLVATGWATLRRRGGRAGRFERIAAARGWPSPSPASSSDRMPCSRVQVCRPSCSPRSPRSARSATCAWCAGPASTERHAWHVISGA